MSSYFLGSDYQLEPLTWLETSLDPLATRYLKSWLGLAKVADPSRLFLPPKPWWTWSPLCLWAIQEATSGQSCPLNDSRNRGVQLVTRSILDKEARFKVTKFKPVTFVQQVLEADPGAYPKFLSLRSKKCVQADEVAERLAHGATLKVQG